MTSQFDGQKQRSALTAAEQALRALGAGEADKARQRAAKAAELDQIGLYKDFEAAVAPLAEQLDKGEGIADTSWDSLTAALGMGPLGGLIDELRR